MFLYYYYFINNSEHLLRDGGRKSLKTIVEKRVFILV